PFTPAPKSSSTLMRTDIKEHDDGFEMTIDLPGFKKEDVQAELKDGYLTVNAETKTETSEGDEKKGTWVRKERFEGKCSRTFYVGEDVKEEDIKARFENGTLVIDVPKPQPQPKLEEKKTIAIA
ncbi:Hsp20/alpha crystallin family protein, partial [Ellagibacter isourolithinifaciens]